MYKPYRVGIPPTYSTHTQMMGENTGVKYIRPKKKKKITRKRKVVCWGFGPPLDASDFSFISFVPRCAPCFSLSLFALVSYTFWEKFSVYLWGTWRFLARFPAYLFFVPGRQRSWNPQAIQLHSQPFQLSQLKFSRCHTVIVKTRNGWNLMTGDG